MEKEKEKSYKGKILAALCAAVVCIVVVGVSVFAATSNLITVGDSISITQSGQTAVQATVSKVNVTDLNEVFNPSTPAHIANMEGQTFSDIATAAAGQNGVAVAGNSTQAGNEVNVDSYLRTEFSLTSGTEYVAYKFTFSNISTDTDAMVEISFTGFDFIEENSQVSAYLFKNSVQVGSYVKGAAYNDIELMAFNAGDTDEATIYLVVAPNIALGDLSNYGSATFKINVNITRAP